MTKLALVWHMHQPYYEDLATGEHILPWVRLHAIKDYWGMVALLDQFPQIRATFNLVPSLLVQIEAFADDHANDRHLLIGMKPAESLGPEERQFLVANAFHASFERMIRPHARYAELHDKRQRPDEFTTGDLRDLQVLHKLVWMDPDWPDAGSRLRALTDKQRGYSEGDKRQLREVELELLNAVIPAYRAAASGGRVELSTSPFYHPILPLLCNTDVHLRAHPRSALPRQLFVHPEDAREQLARAVDFHERVFGTPPHGVWPSEGAVSDEVVELLARQGARWTATDEEILARSLGRGLTADDLYRPYTLGSEPHRVRALFRDHELSDLIGFAYQSWDANAAAADFVANVRDAGRRFAQASGGEDAVVTVILDGENAWEHYPGGGRPFLRALYQMLQEAADIRTVTMSEAVAGTARDLRSIFPGSWIDGDFYIWAGHRDDHRAWAQLAAARAAFDTAQSAVPAEARDLAQRELRVAEGSDWFWWYGDDHSSDHDREFDDLFRRHVRNVYRALGLPAPDDLHRTNITTEPPAGGAIQFGLLTSPAIDGRSRDFTQWGGAVEVSLPGDRGTMHRVTDQLVRGLRVAADRQYLYLRLDGPTLVQRLSAGDAALAVLQHQPQARRVDLHGPRDGYDGGPRWHADEVVTAALPFAAVDAAPGDSLGLSILVLDAAGHVIEQHPSGEPLVVSVPTDSHDATNWMA
ncbi:MAG TPA: glycoside hydrolase family 57 protein [Vicinamibacterales bacterium]|nr:glycoside hydrolase family 57 protein [Vicinamibacterales bacterium]